MSEPVIQVDDLSKRFGPVKAVESLSFAVAGGHTIGLLGGNGAGKTTTLGMLLGLIVPSAGSIRVLGQDMLRHRYRVLPRMNFSSPYVDVPRRLTVRENLTVYGHLYDLADIGARIAALATDLDLTEILDRAVSTLSAGQKTRVALAKALLNRPDLLLLDEPTASLDPDTADWVRSYLEAYQRDSGATILLASHNMAEVERLCADVIMLKAGRVVTQGSPQALIENYGRQNLEDVFLDIARDRRQPEAESA
ncbi:MAG: ABC transporter ATP-binding protein [Alphaproteobacteria bacterium]|jgi:ABC-2 type transport system ATP-binding protein|nr:ABC transporter ATP-binding protein [Alphaproteobacteria bacterium]